MSKNAAAKKTPLPGYRTALIFLWLTVMSPILLLLVSVAVVCVGLWQDADGVAAVGAAGLLAALLLPMMTGEFELPGGLKGTIDPSWRDLWNKAIEGGASPAKAVEILSDAADAAEHPGGTRRDPAKRHREFMAGQLADIVVGRGLHLHHQTSGVVQAFAAEKGWQLERDVQVGSYVLDFVLSKDARKVAIESAAGVGSD